MEEMKKIENQHNNNTKKPRIQPPLDYPWLVSKEYEEVMTIMEEAEKMENQHNNNTNKPCIQPPLDYPWLLFKANEGNTGYIYSPTSTLYKGFSTKFPDDLSISKVLNCCYGWLVLSSNPENDLFLWNPVLSKLIKLPPHQVRGKYKYFKGAVLLSPGNRTDELDPNCMIIIFVHEEDEKHKPFSIMYCLLGQQCWNSVCYGDEITKFSHPNPIVMNDLVYVEGEVNRERGKKLFCLKRIDPTGILLTEYCKLPPYTLHRSKEGYFVESFGELFYISITRGYTDLISLVEPFEFNQVSMKWNKVKDVGDRVFVFFVDKNLPYSILSRSRKENKGHSLYCIWKSWYSYSFADNSLSTFSLQSTWKLPNGFDQNILYLPDRRLIDEPDFQMDLVETGQYEVDAAKIKEETDQLQDYDEKIEREALLFCLPEELIIVIFRLLNPVDHLNFRSASKICRLLAPKIEWKWSPDIPISPWLVSFNNHSNTYHLVDSEIGGKYFITPKSIMNTKIIHSNNGWLLFLSNCRTTLSFYNPLTSEIIKLPKLPHSLPISNAVKISFSSSPTTSNCLVVAINSKHHDGGFVIYILQVGNERWNTRILREFNFFPSRCSCPVVHSGDVYVLDANANLAVFRLRVNGILSSTKVRPTQDPDSFFKPNFLLECDGKLLAASISEGESIYVFALNSNTTSWERIHSLGNHTLYLSNLSCFSTTARADWMKNKIFFPRFHDDNIVYYSMETRKYYSLANKDDALLEVEYHNTRALLMSGWIEPSWS